MAWDRTGVALILVGALFLRNGQPPYAALRHMPGVLTMIYGATLILLAYRRYAHVRTNVEKGGQVASGRLVIATGVVTVAFSLSALMLVAFPG